MKKQYLNSIAFILFFSFSLASCHQESEGPTPSRNCKLSLVKAYNNGDTLKSSYLKTTTYSYSSSNELTLNSAIGGGKENPGIERVISSYQYDAEGYLIGESRSFELTNIPYKDTTIISYKYDKGRLSERKHWTYSMVYNEERINTTENFIYDSVGNVARIDWSRIYNGQEHTSFLKYTWKDGILTKIVENNLYVHDFKVNSQGKISYYNSTDRETFYEYDNEGNLTKFESLFKGIRDQLRVVTYDNKKVPAADQDQVRKGHPKTLFLLYGNITPTHNLQKEEFKQKNVEGQEYTTTFSYSYNYNKMGYPVNQTYTIVYPEGTASYFTEYFYDGCE